MSNFDSAWDSFIHETHKHINKMLEGFRDSFKEKMDEIIEMDELFEPFTVKNKEDHGLDCEIDLKTQIGFNLNDICRALDIANSRNVRSRLDDDLCQTEAILDSLRRKQETTFINESGMYEVIIRSNSPKAKPFRKWLYL